MLAALGRAILCAPLQKPFSNLSAGGQKYRRLTLLSKVVSGLGGPEKNDRALFLDTFLNQKGNGELKCELAAKLNKRF